MISGEDSITQVLADIDEPEAITQILSALQDDNQDSNLSNIENPTFNELYNRYLSRNQNKSPNTISRYKRCIPKFLDFANDRDLNTPLGLSTELVDSYVDFLHSEYDRDATILVHTKTVRSWFTFLNTRDYCSDKVVRLLNTSELGLNPKARDEAIPRSEAITILNKLSQHRRGTSLHALFGLTSNCGLRLGGVNSLDLEDYDKDERRIKIRHRPSTGTRLKNKHDGERMVILAEPAAEALDMYIATDRVNIEDEYGRNPLFTTNRGRAATSTLRRWLYEATSCRWATDHEDKHCDGSCDPDSSICSFSYYPHAIRRGSIVYHLSGGLTPHHAHDRFDVSPRIIEKHYDPRSEAQRLEDRKEFVKAAWKNSKSL